MYKTFTLAIAVSLLPLSQKTLPVYLSTTSGSTDFSKIFPYKNTVDLNLFEPQKKTTAAWNQNWLALAQENIRKSEYHFKWNEKLNAYCTPNRKNNLRFFYNDKGFSVEPRTTKIPVESFEPTTMPGDIKYRKLPNWKVNFNLDKKQIGKGLWKVAANKAEYITDKITVQYINNDEGMRQNFIVHQPSARMAPGAEHGALSKANKLNVNFSVQTKLESKLNGNQIQFFHKKNNVLNYTDLKVWDAAGKLLRATFQKNKNKYAIQVDTKDAAYPITIDPISTTASAILESNQVNANLGYAVASAGDVNGDGYSDVIAGAHGFDNGQTDEGAAFVYHGSATGISTTAAAFVESDVAGARLGLSVSTAGDVNGDGYSDIIVGAGLYSNGQANEGAAFVYHGSASGINTTAAIRLESNQASAQMGLSNSVACAGDVNADGYSDVIVGAWLYDDGETNEGVAFVYHGSASGISGSAATTLQANQSAANFGLAVAGAGDVNGDGYSDVIVGAEDYDNGNTDEGMIFIYHGSAAGINNVAVTMAESNEDLSQFGYAVASAGDVNGDGYSDVIVGAYLFDNGVVNGGGAFIYHGSATGVVNSIAATLQCNQLGALFGISVSGAGDINGDGYSDVIAGATLYDNVQTSEGAAFVFFGSAAGINTTATVLESNQANAQMGRSVASAGDVNGDGYSDVIAGANAYNNGQTGEGGAFVYHGSASGISTTAASLLEYNQASAGMGRSVACAGDVNGDGYSDVIVGAHLYDGGQGNEGAIFIYHGSASGLSASYNAIAESNNTNANLGYCVSSAGDVNADGYSEVIAGAIQYSNGNLGEGAFFVYHGSASGISTTPAAIVEGNQTSAVMGISVASAGDVNGDGYSDVIAGARDYFNGELDEGRAYVYHGSATGINTTANSIIENNQASAFLGFSVCSAGDVNGDGFSDVAVGAVNHDNGELNEGAVFIYHGSAAGINITAAAMLENNLASAGFGFAVSCAGDVNGDGYSDLLVGSTGYQNGQFLEGAFFLYYGAASGINTTAAFMAESNQAGANFGYAVACAGDVNGDGYSDVIVSGYQYSNGEAGEGVGFIYYGAASGISGPASAMLESNQASAVLTSVASAGDVNGDGYSDIIRGYVAFDNGELNEGAAFVNLGNSPGTNQPNNLRLYNTDLTTPLNSSNFIFSNFGAGLYAKSFLGRAKGKLVWETRLNYNVYSGTPITNSTFFTAQQASYTDMGLIGIELKNVIDKVAGASRFTKLRARIKYDPVTSITGQVYSPWRNVSSIIDANNLGALPIELISFSASWIQKGKTARLDFKTDKESDICCFDIERSSDGFNFYSVGTLPGKNISGIQSYSFIDGNANSPQGPAGKNLFYRIKIKGIAGQVDYSNMQHLRNDKATEILVFPNPTTDVLQLQLNKSYDKMNVQIFNNTGQLVKKLTIPTSNQTVTIHVQNLPGGKYWLHLQGNSEKQVLQFIKQ